jgi:hypothetical protein
MVENSAEMNLKNSVRSVVLRGKRLLHTLLSRMELQNDEQDTDGKS